MGPATTNSRQLRRSGTYATFSILRVRVSGTEISPRMSSRAPSSGSHIPSPAFYYATGSGTYVANRDRDLEDGQAAIHNRVEPTTAEYTGIRIHKTARMAPTLRDIVRLTSCAANDGHIFSVRKTRKSVSLIMHTRSLAYEVGHPDPAGYIQAKGSSTGWHLHQMNRNLMALSLSRNQGRR